MMMVLKIRVSAVRFCPRPPLSPSFIFTPDPCFIRLDPNRAAASVRLLGASMRLGLRFMARKSAPCRDLLPANLVCPRPPLSPLFVLSTYPYFTRLDPNRIAASVRLLGASVRLGLRLMARKSAPCRDFLPANLVCPRPPLSPLFVFTLSPSFH